MGMGPSEPREAILGSVPEATVLEEGRVEAQAVGGLSPAMVGPEWGLKASSVRVGLSRSGQTQSQWTLQSRLLWTAQVVGQGPDSAGLQSWPRVP